MREHIVLKFIVKAVFAAVAVYAAAAFVSAAAKLDRARRAREELEQAVAAQRQINDELAYMVENGVTDEYIIKQARSYGYVLPDEIVYADVFGQ
ncbi:MAG: septum formation initiator family protein [Oscillospiraceae bacterium]|nr:septum formation initiator family protein [Oscillospiraceae bacterium]